MRKMPENSPAFFLNEALQAAIFEKLIHASYTGGYMKRIVASVFIMIVLLTGCKDDAAHNKAATGPSSSAPPAETSHTLIARYNQLLVEGYKTTNMTRLQEVATAELAEKAYYHMAAIGEGKSRLVSELKKIDFADTDCSKPAKCSVVTRELWDFGYADILTGKRSNEVKDYQYDVRYLLENRQGSWMITDISATGEERKELPTWGKMFRKQ